MKDFYNLFEYEVEHKGYIDEFINIYNTPEFKTISKKIKFGYKNDLCKFLYYYNVYLLTEQNTPNLKDIDKRGSNFHVGHIIPIQYGYIHGLYSSIIGDINNLQVISRVENFKKNNLITSQVKSVFSFFNIDYPLSKIPTNPTIIYKPLTIELPTNIDNIIITKELPPIENYRLTKYPRGGSW